MRGGPLEGIFQSVDILRGGEKIAGYQETLDGGAGEREIDFKEPPASLQTSHSHPRPRMPVGEDPLLFGVAFLNQSINGLPLPFIRFFFPEMDAERLFKGLLDGRHHLTHGNVTAQFLPHGCHALAEAVVTLVLQLDNRRIHDIGHEGNIKINQETCVEKKAVPRFRGGGQTRNFPAVHFQVVFRLEACLHAKVSQSPDQYLAQGFKDAADPRFQTGIIHIDSQAKGHNFWPHDHRPSPGAPPVVLYPSCLTSVDLQGGSDVLVFPDNHRGDKGVEMKDRRRMMFFHGQRKGIIHR